MKEPELRVELSPGTEALSNSPRLLLGAWRVAEGWLLLA
jgi:hypothetical protein